MDQIEVIFDKVKPKNHSIRSGYVNNKIRIKDKRFSIKSIYKIVEHLKWMKEVSKICETKILIDSEYITDQSIITLLETIIYFVINSWNYKISYRFEIDENLLGFQVFKKSILYKYNNKKIDIVQYSKEYNKILIIDKEHFRKVCRNSLENREGKFISITMTEVDTFLKAFGTDEEYREQLTEVIVEILDNALNHSHSDCILNINVIKSNYMKYNYIDVSVVSIDRSSIGTEIKKYINMEDKKEYSEKNKVVLDAFKNHKQHFDKEYNIDNFCVVSAFQKYVTTRKNTKNCGTGLTTLIKALIEGASENFCYAITGKTNIIFRKDLLNLDQNGLIGFNSSNNYIEDIPDKKAININKYDINTNIYNLQFVFKEN